MKKLIQTVCLSLAIGFSSGLHSQVTWYFGNGGGLKFTGGVPAPSAQPAGTMSGTGLSGEGSSVLVDGSNNVIMFSNGRTIWNGSGTIQGLAAYPTTGYPLAGNSSSTQTALIVPVPSTSTSTTVQKAFIFTVNCAETAYGNGTTSYGLRVSLATITGTAPTCTITIVPADLNVLLTPATDLMSERLAVTNFVVDNTGKGGYWVLTHGVGGFRGAPTTTNGIVNTTGIAQPGERSFFAYHVTCATTSISLLDATEKESAIPNATISEHRSWNHPSGSNMDLSTLAQINAQSQLKFSPNAAKVAVSLPWAGNTSNTTGWIANPSCQLYDFDINTGFVGNVHKIQFMLGFNTSNNINKDGAAYGLEFSPNSNYLYISSCYASGHLCVNTATDGITTRIYRYDITTWTPGAATIVTGSAYADINNNLGSYAAMQLGPDNKIYIAKQNTGSLAVINDPNNASVASCGFVNNAIPISGTCMSGLPTTVLIANTPSTPVIYAVTFCSGSPITAIGGYTGETISSYYWEIYASDASGNPVNAAGGIVSPTYAAWFNFNQWNTGTSPGIFTFPGTSTLPCNKYYTVKLALSDGCGEWVSTQQTMYLFCTPTPVITGNLNLCYGGSTTLCVNYAPSGGHGGVNDAWINYGAVSPQCITVSPTTTTTYPVWVTQNGCTGTTSATVTVQPNYTNFSLATNQTPVTNPFYTAIATPTIDPGPVMAADPSFGFAWTICELDPVTNVVIANSTVTNPECWWLPTSSNNFKGYIGNSPALYATNNTGTAFNGTAFAPISTTPGQFQSGHKYRVTYSTWSNTCPGSSISATMYMCGGCRLGSGSDPIIEYGEVSYENSNVYGSGNKINSEEKINIFPNPSNGIFTVNLPGGNVKDVVVYDIMGNVVFEKHNSTDADLTLDLTNQANGIYLVKVISNGEIISKRIIKQ